MFGSKSSGAPKPTTSAPKKRSPLERRESVKRTGATLCARASHTNHGGVTVCVCASERRKQKGKTREGERERERTGSEAKASSIYADKNLLIWLLGSLSGYRPPFISLKEAVEWSDALAQPAAPDVWAQLICGSHSRRNPFRRVIVTDSLSPAGNASHVNEPSTGRERREPSLGPREAAGDA